MGCLELWLCPIGRGWTLVSGDLSLTHPHGFLPGANASRSRRKRVLFLFLCAQNQHFNVGSLNFPPRSTARAFVL